MRFKKLISNVIVPNFKSFCKHATIHGVYYFYKSTNCFVHIIWSGFIISGIILCGFLSHMILQKFFIDPTLTVVETTQYAVVNIPFPAVTVCDSEQVFLPQTHNITNLLRLRGYNRSQIHEFYRSFTDVKNKGYSPEPFVKKMHLLLEDIGYPMKTLLRMFKRPCSTMITDCSWRSMIHNCSDMFRSVWTVVGHCCQFDVPYFSRHTQKDVNIVGGVNANEALDLVVLDRINDGLENTNSYPKLYVYDVKDSLTITQSSITLPPESLFDVNIYVWAIDSSENVKALTVSNRKCILETDHDTDAEFYQECLSRLIIRKLVQKCKCLPFDYTAKTLNVDEYQSCSWERLICIYQSLDMIQVNLKDIIAESKCYQRCDYVQYDTEVEFLKNQRHLETVVQNQSHVLIHFSQTTCIKYRREVLYTWDQMLANLGGIFGLCLGGSIISIMEIVWFIFELIYSIISFLFKQPDLVEDRHKVFTVSQKDMALKKIGDKKLSAKYKFVH